MQVVFKRCFRAIIQQKQNIFASSDQNNSDMNKLDARVKKNVKRFNEIKTVDNLPKRSYGRTIKIYDKTHLDVFRNIDRDYNMLIKVFE